MLLGAVQDAPTPELELAFLSGETLVWQKGAAIGGGRFGQVFAALRVPSAELLAVKELFVQEELALGNDGSTISLQRVQTREQIDREIDIVCELQHENIVRFIGSERQGPVVHIFMEYLPLGSISKLVKDFGPLQEPTVRQYIRQVVAGVAYLHDCGIAHRDLKCANLLLAADGTVKIADFGTAKRATSTTSKANTDDDSRVDTARSVREGLGSPHWMAPEIVRAEKGDDCWQKADVWGIGCVMIEMATGSPPWDNLSNPLTAMFQIASATATPVLPPHLSSAAHAFLACCFVKDPAQRASAPDLLRHPFLTSGCGDNAESKPQSELPLPDVDHSPPHEAKGTNDSDQNEFDATAHAAAVVRALLSDELSMARTEVTSCRTLGLLEPDDAASIDSRAASEQLLSSSESASPAHRSGASTPRGSNGYSDTSHNSHDADDAADEELVYSSDDDDDDSIDASLSPGTSVRHDELVYGLVRSIGTYTAEDDTELSLDDGDVVEVMELVASGWWRGRHQSDHGRSGWFPSTYVEWVMSAQPVPLSMAHNGASELGELTAECGELVSVVRCELRDDRVWALCRHWEAHCDGWVPIECVVGTRQQQPTC